MPQPRTDCYHCGRDVAVTSAGTLYPHREDPTRSDTECVASGAHAYPDDAPNEDPPAFLGVNQEPGLGRPEPLSGANELAAWWRMTAQAEIDMVVSKAVEYGATDLRDLGRQVLEMAGRNTVVPEAEATEIGIAFYAAGKLARIMAAVKEGRRPSLDTWLDLGVYARMAQRVHSRGGWPALQYRPLEMRRATARLPITEEAAEELAAEQEAMRPTVERLLDGLRGL